MLFSYFGLLVAANIQNRFNDIISLNSLYFLMPVTRYYHLHDLYVCAYRVTHMVCSIYEYIIYILVDVFK